MEALALRVVVPLTTLVCMTLGNGAEAGTHQSERSNAAEHRASTESNPSIAYGTKSTKKLEGQAEDQRRTDMNEDQRSAQYKKRSWRQVSGEIERVKKVAVRGGGQDHLAVLLTSVQGRRMVADLGPAERFRDVELRAGDWISARGPVERVDDRRVIFARELNVDGRTIRIERRMPSRHSAQKSQPIGGRIAIIEELKIKGGNERHQVVRIMTKEGNQLVVDLGKKGSLADIDLAYGEEISVEGPMARLSGKPFMLAQKVTTQGKTARIEREFLSATPSSRELQGASVREESDLSK